jgi:hypothetical protein
MAQVVQAKCPGCQRTLRIPSDWVQQAIKCKYCGTVLQARAKPASGPAVPPPVPPPAARPPRDAAPAPAPTAADESPFGSAAGAGPIIRTPYRRRSHGPGWLLAVVGVLGLLAGAAAAFLLRDRFAAPRRPSAEQREVAAVEAGSSPADTPEVAPPSGRPDLPSDAPFPRRFLAIGVCNYLYANSVGYGSSGPGAHNLHTLVQKLSRSLRIRPDQVVELSDGVYQPPQSPAAAKGIRPPPQPAGPQPVPTVKAVLEKTLTAFLNGCRAQDRILVLFAGHAIAIDDTAYLVPAEGELTVKESLIPLQWVYDQLAQCKARQKVLILDVCRFDPSRGAERPGGGPMDEKLDRALKTPPPGVQVWSACVAGQYSFESDGVSVFLDQLHASKNQAVLRKMQHPEEPLPLEALAQTVGRETEAAVEEDVHVKQTPRLVGKEAPGGAAYDPNEPFPPKLVPEPPPVPGGNVVPRAEVARLLQEIELPPVKLSRGEPVAFRLETVVPFSAQVMEPYKADYANIREFLKIEGKRQQFPLRAATLDAIDALRKYAKTPLREDFRGSSNDRVKAEILKDQRAPARIIGELDEVREKMQRAADKRDEEPSKRWQAHFDYVYAALLARLTYLHEYNLMLGRIRQDRLPERNPKVHGGWRLASREKPQGGKEVRDLADESKKILNRMVRQYQGTPWEVLARRERLTALGLEWQPTR